MSLLLSSDFLKRPSKGISVKVLRSGCAQAFDGTTQAILINVDVKGRYFLNSREISLSHLPSVLMAKFKTRANWTVYVSGDPEASYGDVVQAMDAVRMAHGQVVLLTLNAQ